MTITPVAAAPAAPTTGGAGGGSTGDGFRALVQRHLADDPASGSGELSLEAASAILEAASGPSAVPSDGLALLLAGLLAAPAAAAAAAPGTTDGAAAPGTTEGAAAPGDAGPLFGTTPAAGLLADPTTEPALGAHGLGLPGDASNEAAAAMPALSGAAAGHPGSGVGGTTTGAGDAAGRSDDTDADAAATSPLGGGLGQGDATAQAVSPGQSGHSSALAADTSSPSVTASGEPGSSTPLTATASTTATTATTAVPATTADAAAGSAQSAVPVSDQVFEQVSRLVARGDGTHRLMLRLHPADLGEVKVVLTAKDGAVDITVSAGPEACEALREGSPRLRSLLELAGATSGAVSIRDLGSGALVASTGSGQQPQHATGSEAGQHGAASRDGHLPQESPDGRGGGRTGAPGSSAAGDREPAPVRPGSGSPGGPGSRSRLDIDI